MWLPTVSGGCGVSTLCWEAFLPGMRGVDEDDRTWHHPASGEGADTLRIGRVEQGLLKGASCWGRRGGVQVMQELLLDVLRALASPNLDIRQKTLDLALDLVTNRNIDEAGRLPARLHPVAVGCRPGIAPLWALRGGQSPHLHRLQPNVKDDPTPFAATHHRCPKYAGRAVGTCRTRCLVDAGGCGSEEGDSEDAEQRLGEGCRVPSAAGAGRALVRCEIPGRGR